MRLRVRDDMVARDRWWFKDLGVDKREVGRKW